MAGTNGILPELPPEMTTQSFLDWLRGKNTGRGVPTWTRPGPGNAQGATGPVPGRLGGYPGWQRGMPLAPGNSPSQMQTRYGGTYSPSGNQPVPNVQPGRQLVPRPQLIPNATGGNLPVPIPNATGQMQPQLLGAGGAPPLGGAGAPMAPPTTPNEAASRAGNLGMGMGGLGALIAALKSTPTAANDTNPQEATKSPGGPVQYGGTLPPAWQAQQPKPFPTNMQTNTPMAQSGAPPVPMPQPRPQMAQQPVPMPQARPPMPRPPMPRPQMAQQVPLPRARPPQMDQNSILRALLSDPKFYDHQAVNTANN